MLQHLEQWDLQRRHVTCDPSTDPNCTPPAGIQGEGNCIDGIDNDGDGFPDKSDSDCVEECFDETDNDGDGLIDSEDEDCGGGPPPTTVPGSGTGVPQPDENPSPVGDRNSENQLGVDIVPVLGNDDSQTVLAAALQTNLLPIQAEAELPREDICDDGQDNNHNGLIDSEDPSCSAGTISSVGLGSSPTSIPYKSLGNMSKSYVLNQKAMTSLSPTQQSNISVISISGEGKHDIRTMSSFHYRYSPEKIAIEKGSIVIWLNQDPDQLHGINLIDKISGKIVFSYPVIRSGASAYYHFQEAGQFTYSDPKFPSMTGEITAVS